MSPSLRHRRPLGDHAAAAEHRRGQRRLDPRRVVAIVAVAVLLVVGGASAAVYSSTQRTRAAVKQVSTAIDLPTKNLLTLERALVDGQDALNAAAGATGTNRAKYLAQAVGYSGDVASAWTRYNGVATGLPR